MNTEQIWNDLNKDLQRFVLSKIRDKDTVKDILQEVYIKIHLNLEHLRDKSKVTQLVYQVTRNTINDHFRKQKYLLDTDKMELPEEVREATYNEKFVKCMFPFIDRLPGKYKEAIMLVEINKLSQLHLAEKLNISYSAAKSGVQRAREMLKKYFDDCCVITTDKYGNIISHEPKGKYLCFNH